MKRRFIIAAVAVATLAYLGHLLFQQRLPDQGARPGNVEVVVVPASSEIRELDPLFLKVRLTNHSAQPIQLERAGPFRAFFSTILLFARLEGSAEDAFATNVPTVVCATGSPPVVVAPGTSLVSHEVMFHCRYDLTFKKPGTYWISARVDFKGGSATATPVPIRVTAIPPKERRAVEESFLPCCHVVQGAPDFLVTSSVSLSPEGCPDAKLALLEQSLSACKLKDAIQWQLASREFMDPDSAQSKKDALDRLRRLQQRVDPILGEIMEQELAWRFAAGKEWAEVEACLARMPDESHARSQLRQMMPK